MNYKWDDLFQEAGPWDWEHFIKDPWAFVSVLLRIYICRAVGHKPAPPDVGGYTVMSILSEGRIKTHCLRCGASQRQDEQ